MKDRVKLVVNTKFASSLARDMYTILAVVLDIEGEQNVRKCNTHSFRLNRNLEWMVNYNPIHGPYQGFASSIPRTHIEPSIRHSPRISLPGHILLVWPEV